MRGTRVTPAGVMAFRAARPDCELWTSVRGVDGQVDGSAATLAEGEDDEDDDGPDSEDEKDATRIRAAKRMYKKSNGTASSPTEEETNVEEKTDPGAGSSNGLMTNGGPNADGGPKPTEDNWSDSD